VRILVVDDSLESRRFLRSTLSGAGFDDILLAGSAQEAFRLLGLGRGGGDGSSAVDLLLLDLVMPDIDGLSACRILRGLEALHDVPIIVVTADTAPRTLEAAFVAGASDFIPKPFQRIELLARVRAALALKDERDKRRKRERELLEMQTKLESMNQELVRLSSTDGLTGIANRRTFDEALSREWRRAMRDDAPLSVLMVDVDYFKAYNDANGHQGGDDCLRSVAQALARSLRRPGDLVARYGGEEFAALLPATPERGALTVAHTLREAVESLDIAHSGSAVAPRVTVSIGVASGAARRGSNASALVEAADQALYCAKRDGRNRVRAFDQPVISALHSTLAPAAELTSIVKLEPTAVRLGSDSHPAPA
jgi:diguanylate cyclase (GGDEF)-like protein